MFRMNGAPLNKQIMTALSNTKIQPEGATLRGIAPGSSVSCPEAPAPDNLHRMTKYPSHQIRRAHVFSRFTLITAVLWALEATQFTAPADETCSSPYLARIEGQEEFLYVWTLGVERLGDGADKLVTVDVKPGSSNYGKVIHSQSLGGRIEAHHGGFTDDRLQLWLCGIDGSRIFVFDVYSQPGQPRLVKTIENFEQATGGAVGPHGAYALPGRVLMPCLSNARNKSGRTALVEYSNEGDYITTHQPKQVFSVPGAPLEIRWAWGEKRNYAFTAVALGSKLWPCYEDSKGKWQVKDVATIGGAGGVLPVDISLSADDQTLFVDCFGDGKCRVFDVSNPHQIKQICKKQIGKQLNMVSQSWDGKRLYFSSSLLANWDKVGDDNEQFVKACAWNGKELTEKFALDFTALKLSRPHHMLFGSSKLSKENVAKAD